jgi:hypothetical protein
MKPLSIQTEKTYNTSVAFYRFTVNFVICVLGITKPTILDYCE